VQEQVCIRDVAAVVAHERLDAERTFELAAGTHTVGPYEALVSLQNGLWPWDREPADEPTLEVCRRRLHEVGAAWQYLSDEIRRYCGDSTPKLAERLLPGHNGGNLADTGLQQRLNQAQAEGVAKRWLAGLWDGWPNLCRRVNLPEPPSMHPSGDEQGSGQSSGQGSHSPNQAGHGEHPSHSEDFTSVNWFGTHYTFSKGQQAEAVRALWVEWERGGHGLSQEKLAEKTDSQSSASRLSHVFRNRNGPGHHPAWNTMIRQVRKGVFQLVPPQPSTEDE
jgi:hypothetical protein